MAIRSETKTIDGHEYMVRQYGARLGGRIQIKLAKLFGPAISAFLGSSIENGKVSSIGDLQIDPKMIESGVEKLVSNISERDWDELIIPMFVNYVWKDNKEIRNEQTFDTEFAGEYLTIYKVLYFIIEVNYSSFFKRGSTGND